MASEPQQTVTAEQLMALKSGPDALRTISELLQVRKMGPADHIRTKHEIRLFLDSGKLSAAADLLYQAERRREVELSKTHNITIRTQMKY